jgi:hypothetical protein
VPRRAVIANRLEPTGKTLEELDEYDGPLYRTGPY